MPKFGRAVLYILAVSYIWIDHGQGLVGDPCNIPFAGRGICSDIKKCPPLLDMLRRSKQNPQVANYLRQSVCGYEGSKPIVCCPEADHGNRGVTTPISNGMTQTNISSTGTTMPTSEVSRKRSAELKKVVGGAEADRGYVGDPCNLPFGGRGICLDIKKCPPLVNVLKRSRQNPHVANYLRRSVCGYEGSKPIVCCPEADHGNREVTTPISNGMTQTTISSRSTTVPGADVCGKLGAEIKKVVGGADADLGMFRWVAALGYRSQKSSKVVWRCAGSLVTDRHVMTAAHCLVNRHRFVLTVVRLGDLDLNDRVSDDATPVDYEVDKWIAHPRYIPSEKVNDIAVIRLKKKVTFTRLIQPICLPTLDEFRTRDFTGYSPYVTGWGAKVFEGPKTTRLQQVQVEVADRKMCKKAYAEKMPRVVIDIRVVCAGEAGKDSCKGDSGGPLMMPRGRNGNYYLYGIVSYGYKCAEPGIPGVYTRVSEFMNWIKRNLK